MDSHSADQTLFADTLCCELSLPLAMAASAPHTHSGAELRLRAIAMVEDGRIEETDERSENALVLQRLEAKLDLVLALCASLVADRTSQLQPVTACWSARGMRLQLPAGQVLPQPLRGVSLQAADWLPDPVQLPVRMLAHQTDGDSQQLWLAFDALAPGLQAVLERHLFRLHRRQVAQNRRQR